MYYGADFLIKVYWVSTRLEFTAPSPLKQKLCIGIPIKTSYNFTKKKACYVLSCLRAYKVLHVYSNIWWRLWGRCYGRGVVAVKGGVRLQAEPVWGYHVF